MMISLNEWLQYIADGHPKWMDLGLERIQTVATKLNILNFNCPVITVTGTNGKGSCVCALEQIYLAAGYQVGAFTSPHLWKINEEIRINGKDIDDEPLISAFNQIENVRQDISLTLFEYMTLAALIIFHQSKLDVVILEVGLGGRTDAVNIVDGDIAIITSIGLDHQAYLGDTRAKIAIEKAGIMRYGRQAICGDGQPPEELLEYARFHNVTLHLQNHDFKISLQAQSWDYLGQNSIHHLPIPMIKLSNAACALRAIEILQARLPVKIAAMKLGLQNIFLPGRYQVLTQPVLQVFDVAHNPQAATILANKLRENLYAKTHAVFSMLSDKDIEGTVAIFNNLVDVWHVAELKTPRRASTDQLRVVFAKLGIADVIIHDDINLAYQTALANASADERLVIFGSFHTVAEILKPMIR